MRNKSSVAAGIALTVSFLLLIAADSFYQSDFFGGQTESSYYYAMLLELVAFLVPACVLFCLKRVGVETNARMRSFSPRALGFVIYTSLAVSFLSFLLNYAATCLFDASGGGQLTGDAGAAFSLSVLAACVVPALAEEVYLRGAVFSAYEFGGTATAIAVSALAFSLLHAQSGNLLGPLIAGLAYAYMTYALDSIWPAILSHFFNNFYALLMARLMSTYSAFGLWPYFLAVNVLLFLLFAVLSLNALQHLMERSRVKKMKKSGRSAVATIFETIFSPGFLVFAILFLTRALMHGQ